MKRSDASNTTFLRRRQALTRRWARMLLGAAVISTSLLSSSLAFGQAVAPRTTTPKTTTAPRTPTAPQGPAVRTANNSNSAIDPAAQTTTTMKTMAVVNGEPLSREELATECRRRYGVDVLESMVNKAVILQACAAQGITITEKDVNDEVDRIAKKFGLSRDRWLVMLEKERNVTEDQYRNEIIWPTLALRSLAHEQLQVTQEEIQREFETEFGPKIKARIIMVSSSQKAKELLAQAKAKPELFGELAKLHSEDTASASAHGLIPPISMHVGEQEILDAAFALKEGEVSSIIPVADKFLILKCDKHIPETFVSPANMADATARLRDKVHDDKLRAESADLFKKLQDDAHVVNVYNDANLRKQYPGVAATINGKQLTIAQLSEECIRRYGTDVLDGEIHRKILLQELKRKNLQVTQQDLDDEIARAALNYGYMKPDGSPDLEKWQASIEQADGASIDLYIRDAVWPSVALKKLVGDSVQITEKDLQKGFQANYGERVEVLAIVLPNNRVAQTVWEQARSLNTDRGFGELAAQYSIDPVSRGNDGRVPPIRMHGGQPKIEEEAFKLQPGQLSSIVAIEDKFIIMRCLGRTRPVVKDYKDVKDELYADIEEKMMRVAMAKEFERLKEAAQIDNFLTGTVQAGSRGIKLGPANPDDKVVPASGTKPAVASPRAGSQPLR